MNPYPLAAIEYVPLAVKDCGCGEDESTDVAVME
jgi:hypothetical protein